MVLPSNDPQVDNQSTLRVPQGTFELQRLPFRRNLRAWDAADEYVLNHLAEVGGPVGSVLTVNDSFGALACALSDSQPTMWSDSVLSHEAASLNLEGNRIDPDGVTFLASSADLTSEATASSEPFGTVIIKVPKTLALLEYQLSKLRSRLGPDSVVIAAGMSKHIHSSTLDLFGKIIGPTTTSLAKRKARLAFVTFDADLKPSPAPVPTSYEYGSGLAAVTMAGVFSHRRLDIGTRFLLEHLPTPDSGADVLDLGCGNGIVGVSLAKANETCSVTFTDVSYLAVASAEATHARAFPEGRDSDTFVVGDSADAVEEESMDLVVINPPFHDQHVVGDEIAHQMFTDAKRVLRSGGQLTVVANRHLGHHKKMNQLFGNVKTLTSNSKFVILRSNRP